MQRFISAILYACLTVSPVPTNTLSFIRQRHERNSPAMTLVELVIAMAMVGTLAAIAVPSYSNYIDKTRTCQAIRDIYAIEKSILSYAEENETFPNNLDEAIWPRCLDPWNNPYQYLKIEGKKKNEIKGKYRHFLSQVPVNLDFDLYSMGKDGKSEPPLTAKCSRDDIIRLEQGAYVGTILEY